MRVSRRAFLTTASAFGIQALLAACGGSAASPTSGPTNVPSTAPSAPPTAAAVASAVAPSTAPTVVMAATVTAPATAGAAATASRAAATASRAAAGSPVVSGFPVTIPHRYGSTRIAAAPRRVLSFGYTDQDCILALGVTPVGILRWLTNQPRAVGPWAEALLGTATPRLFATGEIDFEAVAALAPDLIICIQSPLKETEYQRLSAIAPTVAPPAAYPANGVPWREQGRLVATALGQGEAMERIIGEVEGRFAATKRTYPQFVGKTFTVGLLSTDGSYYFYPRDNVRSQFLKEVGFTLAPAIETAGATPNTKLSNEQLGTLDADLVVMLVTTPEAAQTAKADPLLARLSAAQAGRLIFLEEAGLRTAFSVGTVLSIPYTLDGFLPLLANAIR